MTHSQTQGADGAGTKTGDELAKAATSDVRSLLRTARSGLATYGAGAFEGTIAQIDAILAFDPDTPAPVATPGVPVEVREAIAPFVAHYHPWMDEWPDDVECTVYARPVTYGDLRRALALIAAQPAGQSTDDGTDRCEVCNKPLIAGQRVMQDVELGTVHTACCGPEREAYVKDVETGEPLGPNDPIPQGYVYEPGPSRPVVVCNGDPAGQSAGQAGDAGADARTVLTEACKPWEHYTGEPPDDGSPLSGVFVAGMVYTERLLAKLLNVTHYEGGDGSEDFDSDATQTLRNILTGAGLWDADENRAVKPAPDSTRTGPAETEETVAKALYRHDYGSYPGQPEWDAAPASVQKRYRALSEAALAARPEAPSDAGWRERAATEIDAIAHEWGIEGNAHGRAYAKTIAAILRAESPTPPSDLAHSGQEDTFPKPRRKDGEPPCGECHLHAGETCDICGAVALPAPSGQAEG